MRILIIPFFLFIFGAAYGQVNNGGIVVFDMEQGNPYVVERSDLGAHKNLIKIGIFSPLRGVFELGYERLLPQGFSIESFIGYTYRDYIFERFSTGHIFNSDILEPNGGVSGRLGLKYYPFSEGWFSGLYFANEGAYRMYNFTATLTEVQSGGNYSEKKMKLFYDFAEIRFSVGQNISSKQGRFFVDYRVGLIYRIAASTYPEFVNNGNNATYTARKSSRFGPAGAFNIMMGYAF